MLNICISKWFCSQVASVKLQSWSTRGCLTRTYKITVDEKSFPTNKIQYEFSNSDKNIRVDFFENGKKWHDNKQYGLNERIIAETETNFIQNEEKNINFGINRIHT